VHRPAKRQRTEIDARLRLIFETNTPNGRIRPTHQNSGAAFAKRTGRSDEFCSELAVNVRTDVAVPFAGTDVDVGLSVQPTEPVFVMQEKLTMPSNPLTGETVTVKFADPPALTVALAGATEALKSQTCS
jgi:hypothetical protein